MPQYRKLTPQELVRRAAEAEGVRPELALAVAQQESAFDPTATSPKGAQGVMQLTPATAQGLGVNPAWTGENVQGGVRYLKRLLDQYGGDETKALAAYNAGPGAVDQYGGPPPYRETQDYLRKVQGAAGSPSGLRKLTAPELARRAQTGLPPEALDIRKPALPGDQPTPIPPPGLTFTPHPGGLATVGEYVAEGAKAFDPRTPEGQRNLAGGGGALAATVATGGAALPIVLGAGVLGAGAGGGLAAGGQQLYQSMRQAWETGAPPPPTTIGEAAWSGAKEQAGYEAAGLLLPIGAGAARMAGRRLVGPSVAMHAREALTRAVKDTQEAFRTVRDVNREAIGAVQQTTRESLIGAEAGAEGVVAQTKAVGRDLVEQRARAKLARDAARQAPLTLAGTPPPTPSVAGAAVRQTLDEPIATAKDRMGKAVVAAATAIPKVDWRGAKAKARAVLQQGAAAREELPVQKAVTAAEAASASTGLPVEEILARAPQLGEELAVPAVLKEHPALKVIQRILNADDEISGLAAHEFKRELYDAVNFDVPARTQVQGMTKGLAGAVRQTLDEPGYNQANAAYEAISDLLGTRTVKSFVRQAEENPGALVRTLIKPTEPERAAMLRELLLTHGGDQGRQAWDGVVSSFVGTHLTDGGLAGLQSRLDKLPGEFVDVLFKDPHQRAVYDNLRGLAAADAQAARQFAEAGITETTQRAADLAEAQAFARSTVRAARAAGQAAIREEKEIGARRIAEGTRAYLKARGEFRKFGETSLRHLHRLEWQIGDVMRATVLRFGSAWQGISMARLILNGPNRRELLQYMAYSPQTTQFFTRLFADPMSPRTAQLAADWLRTWNQPEAASATGEPPPKPTVTLPPRAEPR